MFHTYVKRMYRSSLKIYTAAGKHVIKDKYIYILIYILIHICNNHTVHKLIVCSHANILMSESESPGRPFSSAPDTVVTE